MTVLSYSPTNVPQYSSYCISCKWSYYCYGNDTDCKL